MYCILEHLCGDGYLTGDLHMLSMLVSTACVLDE